MKRTLILAALLIVLILAWAAFAQARSADSGIYDLNWSTIDSGGGSSSSGGYSLGGTTGQPDAGTLSGGGYTLTGGFWNGDVTAYEVYLPLVLK